MTKLYMGDKAMLGDGTPVRVIEFGEDRTVVVGYHNLLGEYKTVRVLRDYLHEYE